MIKTIDFVADIRRIGAFVVKDLKQQLSYRFDFLLRVFGVLFYATTFFFVSKLLGTAPNESLKEYGGNYFAFVLVGLAFNSYLSTSLYSFSSSIREGQMSGTLEAVFATPTSPACLLIASTLWSFIMASFSVAVFLLLGVFVFGVDMGDANIPVAFVTLFLSIAAFLPFGVLSASFVIVFKRGDPVAYAIGALSQLLGGVYYPVSVLPNFLEYVSLIFPITHSLEAMRLALLQGAQFVDVAPNLLFLLIFSIITIPISLRIFSFALKEAMKRGTLAHY